MRHDGGKPDAFEPVIRQRLKSDRADAAVSAECPEPSITAAYIEQSLDRTERQRWERHFSACTRCQAQLAAFARIDIAAEGHPDRARVPFWRRIAPTPTVAVLAACAALAIVVIGANRLRPHANKPTEMASARDYSTSQLEKLESAKTPTNTTAGLQRERVQTLTTDARKTRATGQTPAPAALAAKAGTAEIRPPERAAAPTAAGGAAERAAPLSAMPEAAAPVNSREIVASGNSNSRSEYGARRRLGASPAPANAPAALAGAEAGALVGGTSARAASSNANVLAALPGASTIIVEAPGGTVVWMVGAHGAISRYRSGESWQPQQSGVRGDLTAGSAPSVSVCWVVGKSGIIVRTIDGDHWAEVASPTAADLASVSATSAAAATVATTDGRRYATSDGGLTWRPL